MAFRSKARLKKEQGLREQYLIPTYNSSQRKIKIHQITAILLLPNLHIKEGRQVYVFSKIQQRLNGNFCSYEYLQLFKKRGITFSSTQKLIEYVLQKTSVANYEQSCSFTE